MIGEDRETTERWPLLTVETEVNGEDSKRVLSWLVHWAFRAGTRDFCLALAALVSPVQIILFLHRTLLQFLCPYRPASCVTMYLRLRYTLSQLTVLPSPL